MARSLAERFSSKNSAKEKNKAVVKPIVVPRLDSGRLTENDWGYVHKQWKSTLFNELYLKDDLRTKPSDEAKSLDGDVEQFSVRLKELFAARKDESFTDWNESQTLQSWIMPVMS